MAEIKKVGVLGAGLMGHGIAQVIATSGYDVVLREVDDETLAKGIGKIEKQLARAVEQRHERAAIVGLPRELDRLVDVVG